MYRLTWCDWDGKNEKSVCGTKDAVERLQHIIKRYYDEVIEPNPIINITKVKTPVA